jgi:hypothetical protein
MRPIDADELKKDLTRFYDNEVTAKQLIDEQPTIEPEQRWIPCSERLPEARQSVILATENWTGEGCYWETTEYHVIWKGYRWKATYWDDEVIAWMPLPEPYREEAE